MTDLPRLYTDLAWVWPILSEIENYAEEAEEFHWAIDDNARIKVSSLLHLGSGGGHIDYYLKRHFCLTGVDISADMLDLARKLNPEVTYVQVDMRSLRLGTNFDAVIIADSIDYMLSQEDLRRSFLTAYAHLKPGGVFCTYAEHHRENFKQNFTQAWHREKPEIDASIVENRYDPDPADSTFEAVFIYILHRQGKLEIYHDRHVLGLFWLKNWEDLLHQSGFEVRHGDFDDGIPFFVCLKPT